MILGNLEDSRTYEDMHPLFRKAFEFLRSNDLKSLPIGKIELDGTNVVVNVSEITGKTPDEAKMETHKKFIDIQVPVTATEYMGWISADKLKQPIEAYNAEKDMALYADKTDNVLKVQLGEFAIFFPEDGHQPGIGEGTFRKIIVKIRAI
ncbi:MAG: YhcH/YjgK/YiaL family protein [Prevotellaceae bacterium]|jgi:YhcH/YjgK/YiaL family protein|nr:YhcH/YjgK/YiaL family protein [Prevotellaceae bacterium]